MKMHPVKCKNNLSNNPKQARQPAFKCCDNTIDIVFHFMVIQQDAVWQMSVEPAAEDGSDLLIMSVLSLWRQDKTIEILLCTAGAHVGLMME
jgi:hypothetical protein